MKIEGKTIIVTGAGSGMGREMTIQLVKKGAKVAMVDLHLEGMSELENLLGVENVSSHQLNITDKQAVEELPKAVIAQHGAIDGLINNAGIIQPFTTINELSYTDIDRVFTVNFFGMLYMTKTILPFLLDRSEAHILNVSSMGGFIPFPGQSIYGASKAGVKLFTEGLYSELKNTSVHVTVVLPGAINTNIMSNSGVKSKENEAAMKDKQGSIALSADKAAARIIRAIERDKLRVTIGKDAKFLDLFYRLSPRLAINFIVKMMKKYEV